MDEMDIKKIMDEIEKELTGDPEHDIDVLNSWGERYRGQPDSEPLLKEIGKRIFDIAMEENPDELQLIYDNMVETADEDFKEACKLIDQKRYDEAETKLAVLTEVIKAYPLTEDAVWTDFTSYLEGMIYQDYFSASIGDREVRRHPMHPGPILYTYGSFLIEMGRAKEALYPLELLDELNPVCMKYIVELGEAYKRTGQMEKAFNNALWGLSCAANRAELARCYRDMAFCLSEAGNFEDAVMLYMLSLHYQSSRQAEMEIAWIRKKSGVTPDGYNLDAIKERCTEVGIPVGISETVQRNMELLNALEQ